MNNIILLNAEKIIKQSTDIRLYIGGDMFDNGVLVLTNFRLLWTLGSHQREISLADINKIESSAGFFNMSSPKIILDLVKIQDHLINRVDWECKICSTINMSQNDKCSECGVKCVQENYKNEKACQKCTFINVAGNVCQMCQNPLYEEIIQIKLSFRQGGMLEFLAELQKYYNKKEWEDVKLSSIGGVSTVLDRLNEAKIKDDQDMFSAFSDLKTLMNSAQEMVQLASSIAAKVASAKGTSDSESEEIIQFRNSLMILGISDPVTREEAKNDYVKKLANQIQEFLDLIFKTRHLKIISTVDLYCLFNRARGLSKKFKTNYRFDFSS